MLTRRVRRSGHGLVLTLPSQLARLAGIEAGDLLAFEVVDDRAGVLRLRRVKPEQLES